MESKNTHTVGKKKYILDACFEVKHIAEMQYYLIIQKGLVMQVFRISFYAFYS